MKHRWGSTTALAVSMVAIAALSSAPAVAQQRTAAVPTAEEATAGALQRDLGLTATDVKKRWATEAHARDIDRTIHTRLGKRYAGTWLNADGTRLVAGVTSTKDAEAVRAAGAEPKLVARTSTDLAATKAALDEHVRTATKSIYSWYADDTANTVVVTAANHAAADAFIAAAGIRDRGKVEVRIESAAPEIQYGVSAGDYFSTTAGVSCSTGPAVVHGFLTAGHCGTAGTGAIGGNNVALGTFRGSSFPGDDYAWVETNSDWTADPVVNGYGSPWPTVAGSQEALTGSSVCRSGATTGWRCGVIGAKDVTINYSQGAVGGLTRTTACATFGDSGGPFISGNQAQGTLSGMNSGGNCTNGGGTIFQPIAETLGVYGLSLVTTSHLVGFNNRCIDVPNSSATDGLPVQMWDCNNNSGQSLTIAHDGTIRVLGKCLDVAWGSVDNGATIQIMQCTAGNTAQQFKLTAAGDLVNPRADKCIDVKDNSASNGAGLQLWSCAGSSNQKWWRG